MGALRTKGLCFCSGGGIRGGEGRWGGERRETDSERQGKTDGSETKEQA